MGEYTGNAGDALADAYDPPSAGQEWTGLAPRRSGVKFSTYDRQNGDDADDADDAKCIRHSKSGWWFSR